MKNFRTPAKKIRQRILLDLGKGYFGFNGSE